MPYRISIHGILNTSGTVCRLMISDSYTGFKAACKVHDSFYRIRTATQFSLVVASSGGYPKDINFIQAHKSVHHAAAFVKQGGTLVMLSECRDNIGSDYFLQFLEAGSYEAAFSILTKKYEGNGGTALSMLEKTNRINIYMLTSLSHEICRILQVKKVTVPEINDLLAAEKGSVAVIKNASILVKQ
jgi:nickel-dependent lactate racemase